MNNLPSTLAARKLMYTLIPSKAHGEIYDPSHDTWMFVDPSEVLRATDMSRVHMVHVNAMRNMENSSWLHWGRVYPKQYINPELAKKAGIPTTEHDWDRFPYEAMLPGFGGDNSLDWRKFLETLMELGFDKPFVIENEAEFSAHTGNIGATMQGFQAATLCMAPIIWPLNDNIGYAYHKGKDLTIPSVKDIPVATMKDLI